MNVNPIQLVQMIKGGSNPQQLIMNVLQQQNLSNNPIINNAVELAKNNNISALQKIGRNIAAQKGLDYDKEFANFKNQLM